MPHKENYVKSAYAETWLEDGIVIQSLNPSINEVSLPMAKQLVADRKMASGAEEKAVPVLVLVNNAINVSKETHEYYATEEPFINIIAIAMVMDNFVIRLVVNVILTFKKSSVSTEIFGNKEKALRWLAQYK